MIRSIRWKLLIWYAVLISVTAAVFCSITYIGLSNAIMTQLDQRLGDEATEIASGVFPQFDGNLTIELSADQIRRYRNGSTYAPYYVIWNRDGEEVDRSYRGAPETGSSKATMPAESERHTRTRDGNREVIISGPEGSRILAGQSIQREREQLKQLVSTAAVVGAAIMLFTLAGGWVLISQALKPIDRISAAASSISARNLSERIDVSKMETELSDLSCTINDAFDRLELTVDRQARFGADASHELRTPLSVILAQADLTLARPRTEAEHLEALLTIRKAAHRMKRVVEDLLTLARADKNQLQLNRTNVDFAEVVHEVCAMMTPLMNERGLTLEKSLCDADVYADRSRLIDAVSNLVSNAVHYNRENGQITVTLAKNSENVSLQVADTGIGISEADQMRVFDRFYQADEARQYAKGRGSGLGLAIAKWIVESHGGSLSVRSSLGEGTVFSIELVREDDRETT